MSKITKLILNSSCVYVIDVKEYFRRMFCTGQVFNLNFISKMISRYCVLEYFLATNFIFVNFFVHCSDLNFYQQIILALQQEMLYEIRAVLRILAFWRE